MATTILRSEERGKANHGWLKSYHTFSFADYYNPDWMAFRSLRVINEDWVKPGKGFDEHPHRDMEILSYIVSGQLSHRDSMGNVKTVKAGEVQAMSAGRGVTHSEFNPSQTEEVHLLQIWILPERRGLVPSYAEWKPSVEKTGAPFTCLASPDGRAGSIKINQNASLYLCELGAEAEAEFLVSAGRGAWLQVVSGTVSVSEMNLLPGDALATEEAGALNIVAAEQATLLIFDL